MSEKCKYCDYVSKCSRFCEYNSIMCLMHRSFPKIVDKTYEELEKENEELKKQLHEASIEIQSLIEEDMSCPSNCSKLRKLRNQQKEFIEWLKQNIENEEYCYLSQNPSERCRKDVFEEVLSKYKEIIGCKE